jgi:hypothetical protein
MYFMRYQEFYESPSPKFRGKSFTIFEFMRWYSLKFGQGSFTYPNDWDGFNIPGDIIWTVFKQVIPDKNIYDREMLMAWNECNRISSGEKFYIIGVGEQKDALDHEIAHGMFYLNEEYRKQMKRLVKALPPEIRSEINNTLHKLGYTPKVYIDETQAYMATGLTESFGYPGRWAKEQEWFKEVFKKFSGNTK